MDTPSNTQVLSVREAGEWLGFSYEKTKKLVQRGHIPSKKIGGRVYVREVDLEELVRPASNEGRAASSTTAAGPPGVVKFSPRRRR